MTRIDIADVQNPFLQIAVPAKDVDDVHINIYKLWLTIDL